MQINAMLYPFGPRFTRHQLENVSLMNNTRAFSLASGSTTLHRNRNIAVQLVGSHRDSIHTRHNRMLFSTLRIASTHENGSRSAKTPRYCEIGGGVLYRPDDW